MTSIEAQYQVLEDGQPIVAEARPATHVYVVRTVEKRKRSCCGGCCCLGVALLVMLLLLFVPRSPDIGFDHLSVGKSDDGATNLLVDLRFHSKQPVTTEWKDLDVKLQWKKDDDDDSVVKVAEFQRASSFSTDAYESQHLHPGLKSIDPVQASLLFAQCSLGDDGVLARLKGSVKQGDAKFAVRTPWKHVICVYG